MRIFILKECFSKAFAFFKIGSIGMKPGTHWLLIVTLMTVFAVGVPAKEDDFEKFSKASCNFTLNILKVVSSKHSSTNIIFSPASINILLSVLQQGAKGNTLAQLQNLTYLSAEESRNAFEKLKLLKEEKNVELEWGNRCYVADELELDDDFRTAVQESFDVGIENMDFRALSSKDTADKINNWVEEVTHNRIQNLVDPCMIFTALLGPDTIMLLINAIFFKGNWLRPFKKNKTREDKFEMTPEGSAKVLFMSQRGKFYSDKDTFLEAKWVQLPFENKRFAMVFVLPTKRHRLDHLIQKLTGEDLHQIFTYKGIHQVKIRVPKFKLSEKISLVNTLQQLGLSDVFTGASDLSGMTSTPEALQVSEIIHQANVEVDEKGSSASAATVALISRMGTPNLSFIADHPFLFFIVDVENGIPLFAGKIAKPES